MVYLYYHVRDVFVGLERERKLKIVTLNRDEGVKLLRKAPGKFHAHINSGVVYRFFSSGRGIGVGSTVETARIMSEATKNMWVFWYKPTDNSLGRTWMSEREDDIEEHVH